MRRTSLIVATALALTTALVAPAEAKTKTVSIQVPFGYINAAVVKAPKGDKCVNIPVVVDVRNPDSVREYVPFRIGITDDFGNIVAFVSWAPSTSTLTRKKYRLDMTACGKAHTYSFPTVNRVIDIQPVDPRADYTFYAGTMGGDDLGYRAYGFTR